MNGFMVNGLQTYLCFFFMSVSTLHERDLLVLYFDATLQPW